MSGTLSPTAYGQGEHKTLQEDVGILPYGVLTKKVLNRTGTSGTLSDLRHIGGEEAK